MAHRDDRSGGIRESPFAEGVKRAFARLADETEMETQARGSAEDYAPPERRLALVGHRASGYDVDMEQMEREIILDPKQDLKERFRRLTYGDMVAVCDGILAATEAKPISTQDELAKVIHRWASTSAS